MAVEQTVFVTLGQAMFFFLPRVEPSSSLNQLVGGTCLFEDDLTESQEVLGYIVAVAFCI